MLVIVVHQKNIYIYMYTKTEMLRSRVQFQDSVVCLISIQRFDLHGLHQEHYRYILVTTFKFKIRVNGKNI